MTAVLPAAVPFFSRRSMAAAAHGERIYYFGGVGAHGTESILDVADDLWVFDTRELAWRQVPASAPWPAPRRCVGWAAHNGSLLLWGGSGIEREGSTPTRYNFLNDVWVLDPGTGAWRMLAPSEDHRASPPEGTPPAAPPPRYTPALHSVAGVLFLFGGYTEDRLGKRKLNDAWIGEAGKWHQVPFDAPQGYDERTRWPGLRYGSMSAADEACVYVCGGFSDDGDHNDLWQFDMASRKWTVLAADTAEPGAPAPRYCSAFALHDETLYLFGGRSRRNPKLNFNDLWAFELRSRRWTMVHDNRALHDYGRGAAYPGYHAKSAAALVGAYWYIWGGEGLHGHVSDFWRFALDGADWQLLQGARSDDPSFW